MIKFIYIYYRKNIAIQKLTTANQPYLCVALVAIQIKLSKLFPDKAESFYDQHAHPIPDLTPGAHVAIQNPVSRAWDVYGVVTAVDQHRRCFVQTESVRVLLRNRRFLRKRTALSVGASSTDTHSDQHYDDFSPTSAVAMEPVVPQRSQRAGRGTRRQPRLIEDDTWK